MGQIKNQLESEKLAYQYMLHQLGVGTTREMKSVVSGIILSNLRRR